MDMKRSFEVKIMPCRYTWNRVNMSRLALRIDAMMLLLHCLAPEKMDGNT